MGAVSYSNPTSLEDVVVPEVVNVAAEAVAEVNDIEITEEVVPTEV